MKDEEAFPVLSITNPNKAWVSVELDNLIKEWNEWNTHCQNIEDSSDYNPQTCSEAIKDGWVNSVNIRKTGWQIPFEHQRQEFVR